MTRNLFYIIIISQVWLSIGPICAHLVNHDFEVVELFGEEEREKEIEIEKEIEKINQDRLSTFSELNALKTSKSHSNCLSFQGPEYPQITTPPPEYFSFLS